MKKLLPLILMAVPGAALAHGGHADTAPLVAGLSHPLSGADHLLAMIAVGLWAGTTGGRARWAMPLAFVAAMVLGGVLGANGVHLPLVEPLILASTITLGAAVALTLRPSLIAALPVVALFGLMHGHAHGTEGPASGLIAYGAGFALATLGLHLAGIGLGRLPLTRVLGGATAGAGLVLALV